MLNNKEFDHLFCLECGKKAQKLNRAPICCSTGILSLEPQEAKRLGVKTTNGHISLENGCPVWNPQAGCSRYANRANPCRSFPRVDSYNQLLINAMGIYHDCSLINFLLALWDRRIETGAQINHPCPEVNEVPLFDQSHLREVANLYTWYDNPLAQACASLSEVAALSKARNQAAVVLYYADQMDGGIYPITAQPVQELSRFKPCRGYPILAGLVYPSLGMLPQTWLTHPHL